MGYNKIKVRVRLHSAGRYLIEYSDDGLFSCWKELKFFFSQTFTGGTECWSVKLFTHKEAESVASSLKTMEDIANWFAPHKLEEQEFYKKKEEYYKSNVPYEVKYFN